LDCTYQQQWNSYTIHQQHQGNTLTITPSTLLAKGTKYTLTLHTGSVTDLAGNQLTLTSSIFTTSKT